MSQQFTFVAGPAKRARAVSPSDWEKHKETIRHLWERANLKKLMDIMRVDHEFEPSRKQYVLQLRKWGMKKYMSAHQLSASKNKRPQPLTGHNPGVVRDAPPSDPIRATKRSRTSITTLPSFATSSFGVPSPDREGFSLGDRDISKDPESADSGCRPRTQDQQVSGPCWMCFCRSHTTKVVGLSAELLKTFLQSTAPLARTPEPSSVPTGDIIERIEQNAEFFLHLQLEERAFQLYAMFLKWALGHKGPLCHCARDLVYRARVGCALSAFREPDLSEASALLERTKSLSPPGGSTELWLLHESIFTWRLYSSRGVFNARGEKDAIRQLETRFKSVKFCGDPTPYKTLGTMTCYEMLPVIQDRDAKLYIVDLELGERHDGRDSASPVSASQGIHPDDLTSCLRWMLDLPESRESGAVPPLPRNPCIAGCNRISGSSNAEFRYFFSSCWTRLQRGGRSVAPSWFENPRSSGIRPTELLAVMVHLVIDEGPPAPVPTCITTKQVTIRNLLYFDESRLLRRFSEMRFNCKILASITQLSRGFCWCAGAWEGWADAVLAMVQPVTVLQEREQVAGEGWIESSMRRRKSFLLRPGKGGDLYSTNGQDTSSGYQPELHRARPIRQPRVALDPAVRAFPTADTRAPEFGTGRPNDGFPHQPHRIHDRFPDQSRCIRTLPDDADATVLARALPSIAPGPAVPAFPTCTADIRPLEFGTGRPNDGRLHQPHRIHAMSTDQDRAARTWQPVRVVPNAFHSTLVDDVRSPLFGFKGERRTWANIPQFGVFGGDPEAWAFR